MCHAINTPPSVKSVLSVVNALVISITYHGDTESTEYSVFSEPPWYVEVKTPPGTHPAAIDESVLPVVNGFVRHH